MAHEGYYSESSNLGNVNDLLDEAELYRDQANASALSAATSETNAAASAATAVSSASGASASASSAAASATNSGNSATNSANSATAAATSATNAASSASAAAASAASIDLGIFTFAKNRIINGDFRVAQRGVGDITCPANGQTYGLDRWFVFALGAAVSSQRSLQNSQLSQAVIGASGNTAVTILQRIESLDVRDLVDTVCTFSINLASSNNRTVTLSVYNNAVLDDFSTEVLLTSIQVTLTANVIKQGVLTFTAPAAAVNGITVGIQFGAVGAGDGVSIAKAQLEVGSVATPFEHRPYGQELALCQRYYEVINSYGFTLDATPSAAQISNSVGWVRTFEYKVQKRATPSLTFSYASTGMVPPPGIAGDANYAMIGKGGLFGINTETGSNPYIYTVVITASAEL